MLIMLEEVEVFAPVQTGMAGIGKFDRGAIGDDVLDQTVEVDGLIGRGRRENEVAGVEIGRRQGLLGHALDFQFFLAELDQHIAVRQLLKRQLRDVLHAPVRQIDRVLIFPIADAVTFAVAVDQNESIGIRPAPHLIGPGAVDDRVHARPAFQPVITVHTVDLIVAAAPPDQIAADGSGQHIVLVVSIDIRHCSLRKLSIFTEGPFAPRKRL